MVNYTGEPFDGPSVSGVILEINALDGVYNERPVNELQVYWATHGITNWCMEGDLEMAA